MKSSCSLLSCLFFLLSLAIPANATSFGLFGTSPLTLNAVKNVFPSDLFTVDVGIKLDPGDSINTYSMSLEFDTDLLNELDIISVTQPATVTGPGGTLVPTGTPTVVESTGTVAGTIQSFAGSTSPGLGITNNNATPVDVIIGSITFQATANVQTDGPDSSLGFFAAGDKLLETNGSAHPHFGFGTLSVNLVPEPSSLALLAMGVLILPNRKRSHS